MTEHFHVFLSYSRQQNLQAAINLRTQFESAGITVFRDEDSIHEGDRWLEKLQQAVEHCDCFVLLVGPEGVQRWVSAETQVALLRHFAEKKDEQRLPIFPLLIDDCPVERLPAFLRLFQATSWDGEQLLSEALLNHIKQKLLLSDSTTPFETCPFVGLNAYQADQAQLFFGRQKETLDALALFNSNGPGKKVKWLEISGNSGSGKSSLMNAGLLPLIEQGWLYARTRIAHWRIIGPMMPGEYPVKMLAENLAKAFSTNQKTLEMSDVRQRLEADDSALAEWLRSRSKKNTAYLLVIDQFEELFTVAGRVERKSFDRLVANALEDKECPLFLLSTVRADFQDRFGKDLPFLLTKRNELGDSWSFPLIGEQGFGEIIDGPARLARLDVSEVKAAILSEAKNEAGALPLVENALHWLWEKRQDHKLSGEVFHTSGGLAGILSQNADELINSFGSRKQQALEFLFNLVKVDPELRQHARRRLPLDEAIEIAGGSEKGRQLIDLLAGHQQRNGVTTQGTLRLITVTDGWVNLIHETLIRSDLNEEGKVKPYWPMLWKYIEKEKEKAPLKQRLHEEAVQWGKLGRWGKFWNTPSFGDLKKFRGLAKLSLEKNYLRAGKISVSLTWLVLAFVIKAAIPSDWISPVWKDRVLNSPGILRVTLLGPRLPEMVTIKKGSLVLPAENGETTRILKVEQDFEMGKYEVTFAEYDDFVADTSKVVLPEDSWGRGKHPVINVNGFDAVAYTQWLSKKAGMDCTLPTENQWEYAARAGSTKEYGIPAETGGSDDIKGKDLANCNGCESGAQTKNEKTTKVGSFKSNAWGLYDMHGNVWEWCLNKFKNLENTSLKGSEDRVLRSGSWDDNPGSARASVRGLLDPGGRDDFIGFRVVCSSPISR